MEFQTVLVYNAYLAQGFASEPIFREAGMFNPTTYAIQWQRIAIANVCLVMRMTGSGYMRCLEQQRQVLKHFTPLRRNEDPPATPRATKASCYPPCHGADLADHYGNRAHDVNVECI